jgi:glycosyltransferase involved in cell wall biosynthesis
MKVSALIPTYNRCNYVQRAIQSVLAQTVPVDEIIVVDDGSTDGTYEQIQHRFGDRVRLIYQENRGVSSARRRAIREASGDWMAFLDSDDEWTPGRNRVLLQAIEKVPANVAWIFGNTRMITDEDERVTFYEKYGLSVVEPVHVFEDPLSVNYPWQFGMLPSSLIKREALLGLNCFPENLNQGEDRLTGIQVACHYGFAAVPEIVTRVYRTSDLSATSLVFARDSLMDPGMRADYYRSEMELFSVVVRSGRRQPWGEHYAESVRSMCKELYRTGQQFRRFSLKQFRYGVSWKSLAFFCAAMLGRAGLRLWSRTAPLGRAVVSYFASARASGGLQE